jgi:hypothetical protein
MHVREWLLKAKPTPFRNVGSSFIRGREMEQKLEKKRKIKRRKREMQKKSAILSQFHCLHMSRIQTSRLTTARLDYFKYASHANTQSTPCGSRKYQQMFLREELRSNCKQS